LSILNLTDELYLLFKTDKYASELRKCTCQDGESIWHKLGSYEDGTVILCENNLQIQAKVLYESSDLKMTQTKIYWAIEELVRLHEHAHHLFFNLQWRNYKSNGKLPFIVQSSAALTKLVAQKDIKVSLKLHKEYEKTQILRSILDQQVLPLPRFENEVIESLSQFAVYYMIKGNAELEDVFKELDNLSPPDYRHWNDIFKSCKGYREVDEIAVVPFVFNVVTSVLSSNGLMKNVTDPTNITIKNVLDSLRSLSVGS
jgi:hypothetical protein